MACCAVRSILITTCIIQLVATVQRQILDFLGYMWTPIIVNFVQIILTILGTFGAYQYKIKYVTCVKFNAKLIESNWIKYSFLYAVWSSLWLGWNIFVICVYFEAGVLTRDTEVLNMGTGSRSWWLVNGAGCNPIYNSSHDDPYLFPTPTTVEGCVVEYFYIEAMQAAIQCFLAIFGIIFASCTIYIFSKDDDSCSVKSIRNLPYSIEYHNNTAPDLNSNNCQRPMTPRKVKQRSTRSKRGSRRRYYQNPVTKLINNQNNYNADYVNSAYAMSEPSSETNSRPTSVLFLNGRPSPIYMNESDTVI